MNQLPKDPVLLLSVVNTQLRDHYANLEELCKAYQVDVEEISEKLKLIGYEYQQEQNQFK